MMGIDQPQTRKWLKRSDAEIADCTQRAHSQTVAIFVKKFTDK